MYYNIHTHHAKNLHDSVEIENLHDDFQLVEGVGKVSVGLHPWYLQAENWIEEYAKLEQFAASEEVVAIGECGLDRVCKTDFALQVSVFEKQIQLAEQLNKPLVIHCVKAFQEALEMVRNSTVPVIFHGINNKPGTIQPVIERGYYLSFGKSLMGFNETILNSFRQTPLEQVFLETDDTGADISEIYKLAAAIKNIEEKEIVLQLEKNFLTVFGK